MQIINLEDDIIMIFMVLVVFFSQVIAYCGVFMFLIAILDI